MPKAITRIYDFISGRRVILALALMVIVAFLLRVVFPLPTVFGYGYVNFLEGDAYSRMYYAKQIADMPFGSGFMYAVPRGLFFPWLIALLGNVVPIELVGAWLPPILAMVAVVVIYLIGKEVFNPVVGLLGALFVAIIPSEFYHRSLLGYPDHHVMEVLLMALAVYLVIKVIRSGKIFNRYSYMLAGVLFLFLANWTGGILLTGLIGLMILVLLFKKATMRSAASLSFALVFGNVVYMALGGFMRYFWWLPIGDNSSMNVAHAAGMASEQIYTLFQPLSERTTSELMPLLWPTGQFNVGVVATNLHFFVITFILGLVFIWKWRRDRVNLFIIIWSLIMMVLALNQRRFMYYFTLPVGLLSAWGIYEVGQKVKKGTYTVIFFMSLALVLFSLPVLALIGQVKVYSQPPEWHNALVWLSEEPDNGMVTAWSDYGHWIQYTTGKKPNLFNGPGGKEVAELFLSEDDAEAQSLMDGLGTAYLIVDRETMIYKTEALQIIAEKSIGDNALANRLLGGESVPYLELLYESQNIRIYEYEK